MADTSEKFYRVRESFVFPGADGVPVTMRRGDLVPEGHEALTGRGVLFEEVNEENVAMRRSHSAHSPVPSVAATETATAAPAEKRTRVKG